MEREWTVDASKQPYAVELEFAEATNLAGVTCGYEQPAQRGIERLLASVSAWNKINASYMVTSVCTATTLDFIVRDGTHV